MRALLRHVGPVSLTTGRVTFNDVIHTLALARVGYAFHYHDTLWLECSNWLLQLQESPAGVMESLRLAVQSFLVLLTPPSGDALHVPVSLLEVGGESCLLEAYSDSDKAAHLAHTIMIASSMAPVADCVRVFDPLFSLLLGIETRLYADPMVTQRALILLSACWSDLQGMLLAGRTEFADRFCAATYACASSILGFMEQNFFGNTDAFADLERLSWIEHYCLVIEQLLQVIIVMPTSTQVIPPASLWQQAYTLLELSQPSCGAQMAAMSLLPALLVAPCYQLRSQLANIALIKVLLSKRLQKPLDGSTKGSVSFGLLAARFAESQWNAIGKIFSLSVVTDGTQDLVDWVSMLLGPCVDALQVTDARRTGPVMKILQVLFRNADILQPKHEKLIIHTLAALWTVVEEAWSMRTTVFSVLLNDAVVVMFHESVFKLALTNESISASLHKCFVHIFETSEKKSGALKSMMVMSSHIWLSPSLELGLPTMEKFVKELAHACLYVGYSSPLFVCPCSLNI